MNPVTYYPPERRRHPRTQLRMTLHGIRLDPDGGDVCDTLQMQDISRGGMGAVADRWLYPGQKVMLRLPTHPANGRRNLSATVVRCKRIQEGYRIGLQFDHIGLHSAAQASHAAQFSHASHIAAAA